jgi:hypothetical protein
MTDAVAFFRLPDGSIHDNRGRMIYLSTERFMSNICEGDKCFICNSSRESLPFNDEHILPEWILRRYHLRKAQILLSNHRGHRYGSYTIPCCKPCNSEMGTIFEKPLRELIAQGADAMHRYLREEGPFLLFIWMTLIFLKAHLKDTEQPIHRDQRLGTEKIADSYRWETFHHLHCVARSFYTGCELAPEAYGSLVILPAKEVSNPAQNFDFCTLSEAQAMLLRLGNIALIAVLNDSCAAVNVIVPRLTGCPAPFSPFQLREIMAHCAFVNLNLKERPRFLTKIKANDQKCVITARVPERLELGSCKRSEFGRLFHFVMRDEIALLPSPKREEVEENMKQGHYTYFNPPLDF